MLTIILLYLHLTLFNVYAIDRVFYLAAVEEEWDYAPNGNLIYTGNPQDADLYLKLDPSKALPGKKYTKAFYREFTDATFTTQKKAPEWLGSVGPFIHAEIGDVIYVHFLNKASHLYSIHPHGVFYNKDSEGAFYPDGTSGLDKLDDTVKPGENYTYVWEVRPEYGPVENDPNCLTWLYHSHHFAEIEVMSGVTGILATCKKGVLDENGKRTDVDKEFSLLFSLMDENFSLYRSKNIKDAGISEEAIQNNFRTFQLANRKHSINGYIYGNLPGLDVCQGDKVSLHIAVVGNDMDMHAVYVQGQTMEIYKHREDTIGLYAGSSLTATIEAENQGKWLLSSQARDFIKAGMQAFFNVKKCTDESRNRPLVPSPSRKVRSYYIAAEEVMWDYVPSGYDQTTGQLLSVSSPLSFGNATGCNLNGTYKKAIYKGYRNGNFKKQLKRKADEIHLGFLGPIIKAEVGDTIRVNFLNRASRPYSIQAYRYFASEDQQGIEFQGGPNVKVAPGQRHTYTWTVPLSISPTNFDSDCQFGRYYSSVDQVKDSFSGLNGPLIICKKGTLTKKDMQVGINSDFYLLMSHVQEHESHYFKENIERTCGSNADFEKLSQNLTFQAANVMSSINGYGYGTLPGLSMKQGDKVAWYIGAMGYAWAGVITPYFHGNTFDVDGSQKDSFPLIPDLFQTLIMTPDNPGDWLLEDTVQKYENKRGLYALYTVTKSKIPTKLTEKIGITRRYYIAAVEGIWNYIPGIERNPISLLPINEDPIMNENLVQGDTRIGPRYKKAYYREFTDETFSTEKERTERELHLGLVGPFIKAEVGDIIKVVFKNLATKNYSIQPHGVFYNKSNEGQAYQDGSSQQEKKDDAVKPGEVQIYEWAVPNRAGPGNDNFNCIVWPYMSQVTPGPDLNAGLMGVIVICKPGTLNSQNLRKDVDREYLLFYNIYNENVSPYFRENIFNYTNKPNETLKLIGDRNFFESNIQMSINGYSYGSLKNVWLYLGETAAFYLPTFGNRFDIHTVHFHGNTFIKQQTGPHRHDVVDVLPGDFTEVQLLGVNVGDWLMHCHVGNHSESGMLMTYLVRDPDKDYRMSNTNVNLP